MNTVRIRSNGRSRGVVIWLWITQILGLLSLLPWLAFAGLSLMAFDSGDASTATHIVTAVWCYPVLPLGSAVAAWVLYRRGWQQMALVVTSIPLLLAVPLLAYVVFAGILG